MLSRHRNRSGLAPPGVRDRIGHFEPGLRRPLGVGDSLSIANEELARITRFQARMTIATNWRDGPLRGGAAAFALHCRIALR